MKPFIQDVMFDPKKRIYACLVITAISLGLGYGLSILFFRTLGTLMLPITVALVSWQLSSRIRERGER